MLQMSYVVLVTSTMTSSLSLWGMLQKIIPGYGSGVDFVTAVDGIRNVVSGLALCFLSLLLLLK